MVLGGFKAFTKEVAEQWVYDKLWHLYGPKVKKIYAKGEFHGILFAQFDCPEDRDYAIQLLRNSGCDQTGETI